MKVQIIQHKIYIKTLQKKYFIKKFYKIVNILDYKFNKHLISFIITKVIV